MREEHAVSMSGEVYSAPLHHHPVFADVDHGPLPVSEAVCAQQVCLPIHSDMTADEAERVIAALRSVMARSAPSPTPTRSPSHPESVR